MNAWLLCMTAAVIAAASFSGASEGSGAAGGTNVGTVQFVQYLDENTALEEVRNGNLDMYYYRIPSDRIEGAQSREGLKIYESTGGSYSMLVNPAESERFNPFSVREARFALNYLVDRKLIVNELMGGYGVPMVSNYGPFDPEYLAILSELEGFRFRYNPELADQMISDALVQSGAQRDDQGWSHDGEAVRITVFIRSDDPVRKAIGEILASELEGIGFEVVRDFGDLNKAFVVVYGSDPADGKWHLYTEGWGGRSAFVRYDQTGLAQMYSPWFSNMPGFNDPSYWNYRNDRLDELTQRIYAGNFTSSEQRNALIRESTTEAVNESVRIFLASKIDQYVTNEGVSGVVNDFGAGVPTRFTPINAQGSGGGGGGGGGDDDSLVIGVKQIYQGAWNPVRGLTDAYSRQIWDTVSDPAVFRHPFTGNAIPIRAEWLVETGGTGQKIAVPDDAIIWDPEMQRWAHTEDRKATSKVTYDLKFGNWHNGQPMDMYDVMHSAYFALEWGTAPDEDDDRTFDTEYTPQAAQMISTLVGIRPINETRIEVYVDYWHFDEAEIADWAAMWSVMPWEIYESMERSVLDGKASFSRSGAVSKNVSWLSLIVPNDSRMIGKNLEEFRRHGIMPEFLGHFDASRDYVQGRYDASIAWIDEKDHAVISNGPFYLESYSPESRTITIAAFDDETYPFQRGHWSGYENVSLPKITKADIPAIVAAGGGPLELEIGTENASELRYFISNAGGMVYSDSVETAGDRTGIKIPEVAGASGTNSIRIFAISEDVLRPDYYSSSFIVSDSALDVAASGIGSGDGGGGDGGGGDTGSGTQTDARQGGKDTWVAIPIAVTAVALAALAILRSRRGH